MQKHNIGLLDHELFVTTHYIVKNLTTDLSSSERMALKINQYEYKITKF